MRERDRRVGWRQILTLIGVGSIPEEEWEEICMDYQLSWDRINCIDLRKKTNVGAVARRGPVPSPEVMKHRNSTVPERAMASSQIKRRKTSPSPSPSSTSFKRRNSIASPSPSIRRNSMAPPSTPPTRRNSMAPPSNPSQCQPWDSSFCTPKLRNSLADHRFNSSANYTANGSMNNPVINAIKQRESPFENLDFKDYMPFTPISPIGPLEMSLKKSGSPVTPKPTNSSVSDSVKVKSKQKPISSVNHVADSGDELDDEQMLLNWKKKALKAKESPPKKPFGEIGVNPPVKRKRGRPTREEVARRLEEEQAQALKMMHETAHQFTLPNPVCKKPEEDQKPEPQPEDLRLDARAQQKPPKQWDEEKSSKQREQQKPPKQRDDEKPPKQRYEEKPPKQRDEEKPPKQRDEEKPPKQRDQQKPSKQRDQQKPIYSTKPIKTLSKAPKQQQQQQQQEHQQKEHQQQQQQEHQQKPDSNQGGSDTAKLSHVPVHAAISEEYATRPAHMPTMAMDLKRRSSSKVPPAKKVKEAEAEEQPKPNPNRSHGRSMFSKMLDQFAIDEHELELRNQTDFMLNDVEAEELLVDDAMELTSPVGGGEGDRDELELDFHVRDESVANHLALIDPQEEMSINRCLEALDTEESPRSEIDQCLSVTPSKEMHSQLTHTSEFFEELSRRPPVNVSGDKDSLLWPYLDVAEVLDYEADCDVLTLAASSDELEEEAPRKEKGGATKPSKESEPRNQNAQIEPPPIATPKPPNPESLRTFRIPKMRPEAQPTVMHSLYEREEQEDQQDQESSRPAKKKKRSPKNVAAPTPTKAVNDDVRKKREEARASRRTKETNPKFGPCYRSDAEEGLAPNYGPKDSAPNYGPADLASMFGPADLETFQAVPEAQGNRQQHSREASQHAPISVPPSNRHSLPETSQYVPENLIRTTSNRQSLPAEVPASRTSQHVTENLAATSNSREPASHYVPTRNGRDSARPTPVPTPTPLSTLSNHQNVSVNHWLMEVFGAKCLPFLDGKCHAAECDHSMSSVGEVERRLFTMQEKALAHTYRQALRSFSIFGQYFKSFADIFERRNLGPYLMQMLVNCRLYRSTAAPILLHIFRALQRCGMEREAMISIMEDLWFPAYAHKFRDLTLTILELLETGNWQDYVGQLMELHKTYKFLLPGEFIIRILRWAEATKNEPLQIEAMTMTLEDMPKYARNSELLELIASISQMPASENSNAGPAGAVPGPAPTPVQRQQQQYPVTGFFPERERQPAGGPASGQQQQPQYPASIWIQSPSPNLPGAGTGPGPSLIQSQPQQYPAHIWSQNPSSNLPGTGPAVGQQQQQQQRNFNPTLAGGNAAVQQQQQGQQQQTPATNWNRNLNQNLPGANAALPPGQQQQNPASYWSHNPNQAQQHDRLPGANTGPSLIQRNPAPGQQQPPQNPASNWNRNPTPNLSGANPALPQGQQQHQQQNPASNWNRHPNSNLPGANQGQQQQNPASYWSHNPNQAQQHERLPGANTGPSLIQRNPAPGHQQQPPQNPNPEANWRSQANAFNTFNRAADDGQYRPYPKGFI